MQYCWTTNKCEDEWKILFLWAKI